ncbi:class I SAM-dependent DNA methyltransferase [Ornithinibacillus halotolerans]|uniref:Methyltransferase YqeM n=1 Tax=Ornithinibacillus halotolerans TaxID=1274357 RepID=A0A916RT17_9BACI|nr:class I SAM-dependent methyltransferase [Ornithinibacillus halotolerans]GGA68874.1 putative methyltransferase YqeM [Ornithinibacillus halotolerans]
MAYQLMANLYDRFMEEAPYDKWVQFTESIINRNNLHVSNIVDLGCGTGEITVQLSEKYSITGVDFSTDMLAIAEQKAMESKQKIDWVHQDIRNLSGLSGYDLAVSYCDVINYITSESDVQKVFSNVYELLNNNGIFIFDVHSLSHVEDNLIGHTFSDVNDESAYVWFCFEGDEQGEMIHDLTFFAYNGENYERFDETHYQRTFSVHVYKNLLEKCGFEKISFYGDFSLENEFSLENAERIFIIAQKGQG